MVSYLPMSQVTHLPMQLMQIRSLVQEDPLEKEMATQFSILAWEIPWTEEPGGLQSVHGVVKSGTWLNQQTQASLVVQTVKNLPLDAGDEGSIPGSGRSPGEGNGYPFQYSSLENSVDRRVWWATGHRAAELNTTERLTLTFTVWIVLCFFRVFVL